MKNKLFQSYRDMVAKLAKSGEEICKELDQEKAHLLHMAIGIAGEINSELLMAVFNDDMENLIEEAGDVEFYLEGLQMVYGEATWSETNEFMYHLKFNEERMQGAPSTVYLQIASGELLDIAKKPSMYGKPINEDIRLRIRGCCGVIRFYLDSLYNEFNVPRTLAREKNFEKLSVRYGKGSFSNEQAQTRADKS